MGLTRREAMVVMAAMPTILAGSTSVPQEHPRSGDQPEGASDGAERFTPPPGRLTADELSLLSEAALAARACSVSDLVRDHRFLGLHAQPAFRYLIRGVARDPDVSIARDDEPGSRMVARGRIVGPDGKGVVGALVFAYHTSSKGWYSDRAAHISAMAGDSRHARLFGCLMTGVDGRFEIRTIRPGGYPRTTLPAHIHLEIEAAGFLPGVTELLFDDDPRLTEDQRQRARREGFLVGTQEPEAGDVPAYAYTVPLRAA